MTVASIDAMPPAELAGQAVLVRTDARDEASMRDSLSTLEFVSDAGARVIVATHCGVAPDSAPRADAVGARLSELLERKVGKLDQWKGEAGVRAVSHLSEGEIMMI